MNANVSLVIQVLGGPAVTAAWTLSADGFDRISTLCAKGATTHVLLGPGVPKVVVLYSSAYPDAANAAKLTFKFAGSAKAQNFVEPIALVSQSVTTATSTDYTSVDINNTLAADVTVDCYMLRNAV